MQLIFFFSFFFVFILLYPEKNSCFTKSIFIKASLVLIAPSIEAQCHSILFHRNSSRFLDLLFSTYSNMCASLISENSIISACECASWKQQIRDIPPFLCWTGMRSRGPVAFFMPKLGNENRNGGGGQRGGERSYSLVQYCIWLHSYTQGGKAVLHSLFIHQRFVIWSIGRNKPFL